MKKKVEKKQLRRLWNATEHEVYNPYTGDCDIYPAKKPMTGKSMRQLVGQHYKTLDNYKNGWAFDRPKFNPKRKYVIVCDRDERLIVSVVKEG